MKKILMISTLLIFTVSDCSVYETIINLSRLKFKLGEINNFSIAGINISEKKKFSDFKPLEIVTLSEAFASKNLLASFTLNIEADNPNDGKGGYPKTDATLKSFPWRLLIDEKETVTGNIDHPVFVPGTGDTTIIPINIELDLIDFFADKGFESLINLALTLGGKEGSTSGVTLFAKPTVETMLGDISYPGELKIVDYTFTN